MKVSEDGIHCERSRVCSHTPADTKDFQTVNQVVDVLKEGDMDVTGFLDAFCWGNRLIIVNPTVGHARTSLIHRL